MDTRYDGISPSWDSPSLSVVAGSAPGTVIDAETRRYEIEYTHNYLGLVPWLFVQAGQRCPITAEEWREKACNVHRFGKLVTYISNPNMVEASTDPLRYIIVFLEETYLSLLARSLSIPLSRAPHWQQQVEARSSGDGIDPKDDSRTSLTAAVLPLKPSAWQVRELAVLGSLLVRLVTLQTARVSNGLHELRKRLRFRRRPGGPRWLSRKGLKEDLRVPQKSLLRH